MDTKTKSRVIYSENNDKIAIINGEDEITYKQLKQKISMFAKVIGNITKGDHCFIFSEPRVGYVYALYAIHLKECTYTTWFHNLDATSLNKTLNDIVPRIIFVSKALFPLLEEAMNNVNILHNIRVIILEDLENTNTEEIEAIELDVVPDKIANIVYTAGITEHHRPVNLTYANYIFNINAIVDAGFYKKEDKVLNTLPYYNTWILFANVMTPLYIGATLVFPISNNINDIAFAIKKYKVNIIVGVNSLYKDILEYFLAPTMLKKKIYRLKYKIASKFNNIKISSWLFDGVSDFKSVRYFITVGAHIKDEYSEQFINLGFDVFEGYGMAEGTHIVTIPVSKKIDMLAVGKLIDGIECKIIEDIILLRGPNIAKIYFNRAEKNKEIFHNGWFFTKDVGYIKDGMLYIDTKTVDLVKTKDGHIVIPSEIDEYFTKFSNEIKELGVYYDNNIFKAAIIPTTKFKEQYDEKELIKFFRWNIIEPFNRMNYKYKQIEKIFLTESPFLRSTSGKLKRYLLKEREPNEETIYIKSSSLSLFDE